MASTSHTASQARGSKPVLESHVDGRVVRLAGGGGHWAIESITYSEWRPGDWTASKKRKKGENQMGRILLGCDTATRGPMRGNGRVRIGGCFPLTLLQLGALGRGTKILHLCWVGCPRLDVGAGRLRKDVAVCFVSHAGAYASRSGTANPVAGGNFIFNACPPRPCVRSLSRSRRARFFR